MRTINEDAKYGYDVISENEKYDFVWGNFIEYEIEFTSGRKGQVHKGGNTGKYFYMDITFGKKYYSDFKQAVYGLYLYLRQINR